MKILIAEDDLVSRKFLLKALSKWGHDVLVAEDGLKAWGVLRNNRVDMVITDWMMPEMDGIELCQKIREYDAGRYIYTIILTSRTETSDMVKGFEAGADDFLTKPFKREELKSRLSAGIRILELENSFNEKNRLLEEANRKITCDLEYAGKIQKSLLPINFPDIRGVDINWEFSPCDELGGDMLNVLRLDEDHYGIYVLDVSGHGVSAALFSVALSRLLSEHHHILKTGIADPPYYLISSPKDVLKSLNRQFPMDLNTGQYFTILYGILDCSGQTFHWSNAGHPPPIMVDGGEARLLADVGGSPIGFFEETEYEEGLLRVRPGQRIVICSDGILEAMNQLDQQFTIDRVKRVLEENTNLGLKELFANLISEVGEWTGPRGGPDDDITLLGLEIVGD